MKIIVNDFGGYAFPVQLSKELAANGYEVIHTYLDNIKTPHGNMDNGGLPNLRIMPVNLQNEFRKYNIIHRYKGETEYAGHIEKIIETEKPDILISANTPLFTQRLLVKKCKKAGIKFIYWCQDIHSIAIKNVLRKKLPGIGSAVSAVFNRLEVKLLMQSDHIISITDDFNEIFKKWGIPAAKLSTINNWAPVNELPLQPKCNPWSQKVGICNTMNIIYSGTLGWKHNPQLIITAAKQLAGDKNVRFIIISNGIGAKVISEEKVQSGLDNIMVLDFQEYEDLPMILGSADILISILEKDAAQYSVPSKVLTYLCSQRPIVLSVDEENLSAKIVKGADAGICTASGNAEEFTSAITQLIGDINLRKQYAANGRRYAEEHFDIKLIAGKFIHIFNRLDQKQ
jgi:glycosyltransferase involved in cell wall biosynthesis